MAIAGNDAPPTSVPDGLRVQSNELPEEPLLCVTRVRTFAGDSALTSATGFFFQRDARLFLVTSRHVLFDAATGHVPDRIVLMVHTDAQDLSCSASLTIALYAKGQPRWRQGADQAGEVDVALIELDPAALPRRAMLRAFGPHHLERCAFSTVGDALAIPGFPLGFHDTVHHLPVVRQAAIASSFGIRFQGRGFFLTDGRTHRGSSGAPVLRRTDDGAGRRRWLLLGIHSSRLDMAPRDVLLDESLGLNCAWYADILMTLTDAAAPAKPR